jgi:hypothetical protein
VERPNVVRPANFIGDLEDLIVQPLERPDGLRTIDVHVSANEVILAPPNVRQRLRLRRRIACARVA